MNSKITPHVFISAVSGDLRNARELVEESLLTIGCHPVVQEHFEPDYRTVMDMLKAKVSACHAVIHVVGFHYGGQPDLETRPQGEPRRSWTQLEHDLAREMGKKLYLFVCDEGYPFDSPTQPDPPDELGLQQLHRARIFADDYFYHKIGSAEELSRKVIELRLEAAELRREIEATQSLLTDTLVDIQHEADDLKTGQEVILLTLDQISQKFATLSNQGGIIQAPTSPEQYYSNAVRCELRGDYMRARGYYIGYFQFQLETLDPHLRFIDFLKIQEGSEGAREAYRLATGKEATVAGKVGTALLWDRDIRIPVLEQILLVHPECAPAAYLLSQEFSEAKLGERSINDQNDEKHWLETFQKLDQDGKFVRWFIDKSIVTEWREDCQQRLNQLAAYVEREICPVSVTWMQHNTGLNGTVQVLEPAIDLMWRQQGQQDLVSNGHLPHINPQTGAPMPNPLLQLPLVQNAITVEIFYRDINGDLIGPFEERLAPTNAAIEQGRMILEMTKTGWLSFREYDGKRLLYFTHLLSYRDALDKITYSLNGQPPNVSLPFQADPDLCYIEVAPNTESAHIQLTYKDGQVSAVHDFQRSW